MDSPRSRAGRRTEEGSRSFAPSPDGRACGTCGWRMSPQACSTRITDNSVGQPWGAAWFPDGNRIAFSHQERLIVQPLGGGEVETFNSPVRGRLVRTPAISPDGTKMMFQVDRDGAWMLDLADNSMRRILDDPTAEGFTWSPDGRRVGYYSRRSGEWGMWMMAPR